MNDGLTASDVALLSGNTDRNNGCFGGDWSAWIVLFLIFGMFGYGGFGGFGNGAGGEALQGYATQADIQRGFDNSAVIGKLDRLGDGIASLGYDQLSQINGVNTNVMQTGFGLQRRA